MLDIVGNANCASKHHHWPQLTNIDHRHLWPPSTTTTDKHWPPPSLTSTTDNHWPSQTTTIPEYYQRWQWLATTGAAIAEHYQRPSLNTPNFDYHYWQLLTSATSDKYQRPPLTTTDMHWPAPPLTKVFGQVAFWQLAFWTTCLKSGQLVVLLYLQLAIHRQASCLAYRAGRLAL